MTETLARAARGSHSRLMEKSGTTGDGLVELNIAKTITALVLENEAITTVERETLMSHVVDLMTMAEHELQETRAELFKYQYGKNFTAEAAE